MMVSIFRADQRVIYLGGAFPKHFIALVCNQLNVTCRCKTIISNGLKNTSQVLSGIFSTQVQVNGDSDVDAVNLILQ